MLILGRCSAANTSKGRRRSRFWVVREAFVAVFDTAGVLAATMAAAAGLCLQSLMRDGVAHNMR